MYYDLPNSGCNVYSGGNYIDNYYNNTRTRYVLGEDGKLLKISTTNYSSVPTGNVCIGDNSIAYKSDLLFWFQVVSVIAVISIFILILKATRLLR